MEKTSQVRDYAVAISSSVAKVSIFSGSDKAVLRSQSAKGKRPQQPPSGQPNMTRQATGMHAKLHLEFGLKPLFVSMSPSAAPGAVYGPDDDALLVLEAEAMAEGAALNHIEKTHKKKVSGSAAEKSPVQEKKEGDFSSGVNMDGLLIPFASIILGDRVASCACLPPPHLSGHDTGSNAGERSSQDQKSRAPINIGSIVSLNWTSFIIN